MTSFDVPQAMNIQEELSERVQELEEELAMALAEVKKTKDLTKHLNDVRVCVVCMCIYLRVSCEFPYLPEYT